MSFVAFMLQRPYTVISCLILIALLGVGAVSRMPIDIFPEIDVPVVAVVWTYNGMAAQDIQNRILTLHERQLASEVDDIERIEATSYNGVGVEKVYLHEGADVSRAITQLASSALVVLKYMPPNITPPLVLRYGATDVPIIQLSLSSSSLPDTKLNDLGQNIIRPDLAVVQGAEVPYPYGGKPRVIMADLDQDALNARGLTPSDVAKALQRQNVILPSGDVKIGSKDYSLSMNNSPDVIASINRFPVKQIDGRTVFVQDVAHVHDGYQVQTNSVAVDGTPGALMSVRKTGGVSTLAVGILVDNGTVVIENIERHVGLKEPLVPAIVNGAGEVGIPTVLSTMCICIVFVPIFLLQGVAKYLFSPLSLSVCISLIASLLLSFTLVPLLFRILMQSTVGQHGQHDADPHASPPRRAFNPFSAIHGGFERGFSSFREAYRNGLAFSVTRSAVTVLFFGVLMVCSLALFPLLGQDFFPQVDAGQMRLHARAPPATRIEETQRQFADVEHAIRKIVGNDQIDTMLNNIGLPYSGINIALSDSATVGPMDGEILVSLKKKHSPTAAHVADLRRELPKQFPQLQFFFQAADIVDQVLNFGQPAPIDIRISGPDSEFSFGLASKIAADLKKVPGIADSHVFQVPDAPALTVAVDRQIAQQCGLDQGDIASNVLVTTNSSAQTAPNFWVSPKNSVSYPLVIQAPTYRLDSTDALNTLPVLARSGSEQSQILMNVAKLGREKVPLVTSQLNIRPVFDVNADAQGIDLATAAAAIDKVLAANTPPAAKATQVTLAGQVETMRDSFNGLFSGMAVAVVLVYLILVINFQSWIDPLIVLSAVPFAIRGVMG